MSRNLISLGKLEKVDFTGKIGNEVLEMVKGAVVSIKETRKNYIYITTEKVIRSLDSSTSSSKADHTPKWQVDLLT